MRVVASPLRLLGSPATAWRVSLRIAVGLVGVSAAHQAAALPDLVVESVDASAVQRECATAQASGSVEAVIRNDGLQPVEASVRVAFLEDRDLDGVYSPNADQLLAEVPMAPALCKKSTSASWV